MFGQSRQRLPVTLPYHAHYLKRLWFRLQPGLQSLQGICAVRQCSGQSLARLPEPLPPLPPYHVVTGTWDVLGPPYHGHRYHY